MALLVFILYCVRFAVVAGIKVLARKVYCKGEEDDLGKDAMGQPQ